MHFNISSQNVYENCYWWIEQIVSIKGNMLVYAVSVSYLIINSFKHRQPSCSPSPLLSPSLSWLANTDIALGCLLRQSFPRRWRHLCTMTPQLPAPHLYYFLEAGFEKQGPCAWQAISASRLWSWKSPKSLLAKTLVVKAVGNRGAWPILMS